MKLKIIIFSFFFTCLSLFVSIPIASASGNLITSYSESNYDYDYAMYGASFTGFAPKIVIPTSADLGSIKFYLKKTGSPTGNITAKVYSSAATPTTLLATSDTVDSTTLTGSYSLVEFFFTGAEQIALSSATTYFFSIEYSGGDASNTVDLGAENVAGDFAYKTAGWSALGTKLFPHYIYDNDEATWLPSATSTEAYLQTTTFGIAIIVVLLFLQAIWYFWGNLTPKKPWK